MRRSSICTCGSGHEEEHAEVVCANAFDSDGWAMLFALLYCSDVYVYLSISSSGLSEGPPVACKPNPPAPRTPSNPTHVDPVHEIRARHALCITLLPCFLLLSPCGLLPRPLRFPLCALAIPVIEKIVMLPHDDGVFDELLHAVHQSVTVARWHEPASAPGFDIGGIVGGVFGVGELGVGLGDGGLVGNGEHAHPAAEDAQRVDGVEGLRAAGDLGNGERAALRGAHGAGAQRDPVDLVLEHGRLWAVSVGRWGYGFGEQDLRTRLPCCSGETQT